MSNFNRSSDTPTLNRDLRRDDLEQMSGANTPPQHYRDTYHSGYGGGNMSDDIYGRDTTNTGSFERERRGQTETMRSSNYTSNINPTTEHQYGEGIGIGQYDGSSRTDPAHAETGHYTTTTGTQSGRGVHAPQFSTLSSSDRDFTAGGQTTIIQETAAPGERFQCRECGLHVSEISDQAHCPKCAAIRGGQHIGTSGPVPTETNIRTTGVQEPVKKASISESDRPAGDTQTTTHTGPSPYHLKPGETIIEKETRVHTGLPPGERTQLGTGTGTTTTNTTHPLGKGQEHPSAAQRKSSLGEKIMGIAGKKTTEEVPRTTGHTIN